MSIVRYFGARLILFAVAGTAWLAAATGLAEAPAPQSSPIRVVIFNDLGAGDDGPKNLERCLAVGSSRVDLQACKLEYSIVSPK